MNDESWLKAEKFRCVGHWSNPQQKLQWYFDRAERKPGIYAFVVAGRIRYIGKATSVRKRLRRYNRSFNPQAPPQGFRKVHDGIRQTWENLPITVWVHYNPKEGELLGQLEAKWIRLNQPDWNACGCPKVS